MAKKQAAKTAAPDPIAVPPKMGTQGPESGPFPTEVIIDADAPGVGAKVQDEAVLSKSEKAGAKKLDAEKSEREVKVIATKRGFLGNRIKEAGDVFTIQLGKGEVAPTWVKPVDDAAAPTPPSHSSEAKPERQ